MFREKQRSEREQLQQKDQSEFDSDSSDSHYDYYFESCDEEDHDYVAVIGLLSAHTEMASMSSTHCVSITVLNTVMQR